MSLFRRHRLPDAARAGLGEALGRAPRPLAWAESATGFCVCLPEALAVTTREGTWRVIGWHAIESGGYNADDHQLVWSLVSGARGSARLADPGLVPQVFRERVQASIVVKQTLEIEGTKHGVTISARRDLGDAAAPLAWRTSPARGTRLSDPDVRAASERALARLRAEYDA